MRFLKIPKPLMLALIAAMFASFPLKMWREYGENARRRKIAMLRVRLAKLETDLAVSAMQKAVAQSMPIGHTCTAWSATKSVRLFCALPPSKMNLRNFQNEPHHPHFKS